MATDTAKPSSRVAMHIALEIATVEKLKEAILDNAKAIYGPRLGVKDFGIVSVRNPPRVKAPDRSVSDPIRQRYDSVITVSDSAAVPAQSGCSPGDPNDADHMRYCAKLLAYMPDGSAWAMLQSSLPESTLSEALEGLLRMLQWMLSDIFRNDPSGKWYMERCGRKEPIFWQPPPVRRAGSGRQSGSGQRSGSGRQSGPVQQSHPVQQLHPV